MLAMMLDQNIRFIFNSKIGGHIGQLDQLEDRLLCKQEVVGSNPTLSTIFLIKFSNANLSLLQVNGLITFWVVYWFVTSS